MLTLGRSNLWEIFGIIGDTVYCRLESRFVRASVPLFVRFLDDHYSSLPIAVKLARTLRRPSTFRGSTRAYIGSPAQSVEEQT